jgi:DNA-binding NtrC family response regulator
MPSLAERIDDIPLLAHHFARCARGRDNAHITPDALDHLQGRAWPGNVRELKQVVEAVVVFAARDVDINALSMALAHRRESTPGLDAAHTLVERRHVLSALERAAWDTGLAATLLGIHRATIYRRMKRLGIVRIDRRRGDPVAWRELANDRLPHGSTSDVERPARLALIRANVDATRVNRANARG